MGKNAADSVPDIVMSFILRPIFNTESIKNGSTSKPNPHAA
jgi:hypothetical protein